MSKTLDKTVPGRSLPPTMDSLIKKPGLADTDPHSWFRRHGGKRGAVWLDSSLTLGSWGTQSLVAVQPVGELILRDNRAEFFADLDRLTRIEGKTAVGFLTYEAALPWVGLVAQTQTDVPLGHFFVYDKVHRFDSTPYAPPDPGEGVPTVPAAPVAVTATVTRSEYLDAVERIQQHIREGDIYQANLTCRFDCPTDLPPELVYERLRRLNPSPYGAYLDFGDYQILSSSPERMLRVEDRRITSSPIKGTIARGNSAEETERNLAALTASDKDRAELLMIVDLVRNDLGKVAATGTVRVDRLFRSQVYSSVIHLMADVSAQLRESVSLEELFAALLPGGSITGAPKKRAVEIIASCEKTPRSVYTGCIGYVDSRGLDFNLAIRTMIHRSGTYHLHAGGGIVTDSRAEAEYDEMRLKARNLFRCLGVKA